MEFLNKKQKIVLTLIGSIMLFFIGNFILTKTNNDEYFEYNEEEIEYSEAESSTEKEEETQEKIKVHIIGAIQDEGIIEIDKDSRIADVIEEAGGTTEEADLSKVNLAYEVKDGQKIYIPNLEESIEEEYVTEDAGEGVLPEEHTKNEKVNINTAKQTELETLSGIGPSTALKIINYRNENGEFKSIEDIKNVPGIGESKFESIKEDICI